MPFLRVIRDKRGYETTYLMHLVRDGARQRSRILYVFRTPGGVRVGRTPLDPETRREIESRFPDISFDWPSVREQQQTIEPVPDVRRRRRRLEASASPPAAPDAIAGGTASDEGRGPRIPSALEGTTPDEQTAFLLRCYPEIRERVLRVPDPGRREALLGLAERLNPVMWSDADQIATGLQSAAEALERLSRVFARRRRRTRKRAAPPADPAAPEPA